MIKIFFDTEFTGLHQNTTLISIGLISEDGRTFYGEFNDYDQSQVDEWIQENVVDNLTLVGKVGDLDQGGRVEFGNEANMRTGRGLHWEFRGDKKYIESELRQWFYQFTHECHQVELWSDVLNYDWTLFRDLFNEDLPNNIYYIPFDLATLFKIKGVNPDINREELVGLEDGSNEKHNSLHDAIVIKKCYEVVMEDAS